MFAEAGTDDVKSTYYNCDPHFDYFGCYDNIRYNHCQDYHRTNPNRSSKKDNTNQNNKCSTDYCNFFDNNQIYHKTEDRYRERFQKLENHNADILLLETRRIELDDSNFLESDKHQEQGPVYHVVSMNENIQSDRIFWTNMSHYNSFNQPRDQLTDSKFNNKNFRDRDPSKLQTKLQRHKSINSYKMKDLPGFASKDADFQKLKEEHDSEDDEETSGSESEGSSESSDENSNSSSLNSKIDDFYHIAEERIKDDGHSQEDSGRGSGLQDRISSRNLGRGNSNYRSSSKRSAKDDSKNSKQSNNRNKDRNRNNSSDNSVKIYSSHPKYEYTIDENSIIESESQYFHRPHDPIITSQPTNELRLEVISTKAYNSTRLGSS